MQKILENLENYSAKKGCADYSLLNRVSGEMGGHNEWVSLENRNRENSSHKYGNNKRVVIFKMKICE